MSDESNIVEFPGPNRVSTKQVPKRPAPEQVTAQNLRNRAQEAARLRRALEEKPSPMMAREDSITVAEALYALLGRIEQQQRIRKAKVLRAAGIGSEEDSTKHLGQYAIPPALDPSNARNGHSVFVKEQSPTPKSRGTLRNWPISMRTTPCLRCSAQHSSGDQAGLKSDRNSPNLRLDSA